MKSNILSVEEIQNRLSLIFPESYPDRGILVGQMASRVIYVFLYGYAIGDSGNLLRPSHIYLFTTEQVNKTSKDQRSEWIRKSLKPGFRTEGHRWYADNSRESIRDDLMRNQYGRIGGRTLAPSATPNISIRVLHGKKLPTFIRV